MYEDYDSNIISEPFPDVRTEEQYRREITEYLLLFFYEKGTVTILWPILQSIWQNFLDLLSKEGIDVPSFGENVEKNQFKHLEDIFFFLTRAGFADYYPNNPQKLYLLLNVNTRNSLHERAGLKEFNAVMRIAPQVLEQYQEMRSLIHG